MHSGFTWFCSSLSIGWFNRKHLVALLLLVGLWGCTPSTTNEQTASSQEAAQGLPLRSDIPLFDRPNGNQVAVLDRSDFLQFTGQVSEKLYYRRAGADTLLEPYLQVILADSTSSWIYGNPSFFDLSVKKEQWQWSNRLRALLSPDQFRNYQQLMATWEDPQPGIQLLIEYQAAKQIRVLLQDALAQYQGLSAAAYENVLPASLPYLEGGKVSWWFDYNQWHERSSDWQNASAEEALFAFYQLEVYPPDGIEYRFPSWQFPVSSNRAHSLLGRGEHVRLLHALDSLQQAHPFVATEWNQLRSFLLEDLTVLETTYWESWSAVEAELDSILSHTWSTVPEETIASMQQHRERLRQQAISGTQFDYRNR